MKTAEHFDAVIVGSGFGGSVAAYRLAESGREVCLLERGKAFPPGSFPRTPDGVSKNFWDPSRGLHGMFNLWSFRSIEALVSSGLGGGSLIYANVLLRKDENWFVHEEPFDGGYEHWPISRADLDPHYDRVERMMNAQVFPFDTYRLAKTSAMKESAEHLGLEFMLPPLAVTFHDEDEPPIIGAPIEREFPNIHGMPRQTCRLCGECDVGCNFGSKNTLDHNYLSAAKAKGAEIRTRSEVRRIAPAEGGGYRVEYVEHHTSNEGRPLDTSGMPRRSLTCDRLVLAAGTLGTGYLLLRNRAAFPGISATLGSRFCGNGDLLGLMFECKTGYPGGEEARLLDGTAGPVITSALRVADGTDPGGAGRGFYLEDAGFPAFLGWVMETTQAPDRFRRLMAFAVKRLWAAIRRDGQSDWSGAVAAALGGAEFSSTSLPLLGMGRDIPDGRMRLRGKMLDVDWTIDSSRVFFNRVEQTMREITDVLGGTFQRNLLSYLARVITVHPLGGAPMGRHPGEGVVDDKGEVFGYPGLFIVDGSVMPGPVGANPALTIAAFSDRAMDHILETTGAP